MPVIEHLLNLHRRRESFGNDSIDLAYITPQLIATSMPASTWWGSKIHTPTASLRQFLDLKHATFWKIWNLQQPAEIAYSQEDFNENVSYWPMPDHAAPTFASLIGVVREICAFVAEDSRNVAVVHCKRGQGRTGTVACAYLQMHHGFSANQAIAKFTETRNHSWFMRGVSVTSQRRYLRYVEKWQKADCPPLSDLANITVYIKSITLINAQYREIDMTVVAAEPSAADVQQNQADHDDDVVFEMDPISGEMSGSGANTTDVEWTTTITDYAPVTELSRERFDIKFTPSSEKPYPCPFDVRIAFAHTILVKQMRITTSQATGCFSGVLETMDASPGPVRRSLPFSLRPRSSTSVSVKPRTSEWSWENLDGFLGSFIRGPKLFDSVVVEWVVGDSKK